MLECFLYHEWLSVDVISHNMEAIEGSNLSRVLKVWKDWRCSYSSNSDHVGPFFLYCVYRTTGFISYFRSDKKTIISQKLNVYLY